VDSQMPSGWNRYIEFAKVLLTAPMAAPSRYVIV